MQNQANSPKSSDNGMRVVRLRRPDQPLISTVVLVSAGAPRSMLSRTRWGRAGSR